MQKATSSRAANKTGLAPGTIVYVGNKAKKDLFIDVFDYNKEYLDEKQLKNIEEAFTYENKETITWINVNGLNHVNEIEKLGKDFELHPLILEDIANTKQRPKLEEHEEYIFVVLKMLYFDQEQNLKFENISFIQGSNYVLSFQEADGDVFDSVRERLRNSKGRVRSQSADYLLYVLMDAIVDNYFNLMEVMGEKIEELEENLFEEKSNNDLIQEIHNLKREILRIRRAVYPLREVVNRMDKVETSLVSEKTQLYLRDLYDHVIQVSESIDIQRELIWSLMDMYMTTISNRMNEVMKVLTIMATIFIPLTFIAGVYGMNFENIPELKFQYGYFVLWGVMVVVFLGMLYYFKRREWL
ncbi:magnesium/cobalt transporter CorA [uncultured Eudoraea sp.]|jgi:magnesium transporter|uniref:magnesium/cobalt transporter CorA n=1 Tax=uncultured Eudoraea sp. TaxID=1035614 RepID=UPI00262DF1F7|nr:magnesium/cobalt transporter CorA [uncultured Eudoraea sp.]